MVVPCWGWGCTRGGRETRGVVVSHRESAHGVGKRRGGGSPLLGEGVHMGWARDNGSGSLSLRGGQETRGVVVSRCMGRGCTWGEQETRGVVVSRWGRGCTRGGQETRGVVISRWGGGAHGVGKRQGEW